MRPAVQWVYWVATSVLPSRDPEDRRPVVVLTAADSPEGTFSVVTRSCADRFGVEHPADPGLGLSSPGRFSRRLPVQGVLWAAADPTPLGRLDDATFAAVVARFAT